MRFQKTDLLCNSKISAQTSQAYLDSEQGMETEKLVKQNFFNESQALAIHKRAQTCFN